MSEFANPRTPPQWQPTQTWDGRTTHRLELPWHESRTLFLVKFRREVNTPCAGPDDLTPEESAAGGKTFRPGDSWYKHAPGHDTGSLRSLHAPAVLTWEPGPRDEVIHTFRVRFSGTRTWEFDPDHGGPSPAAQLLTAATCDTAASHVAVICESHPGRPAALGEDDLDAAFGRDAVAETVRAALDEGDWRPCFCSVRYENCPDGDWESVARPWYERFEIRLTASPRRD